MVKNVIIRLLFEHGGKVLRSVYNAYKQVNKSQGSTANTQNNSSNSNNNNNSNNSSNDNKEKDGNNSNNGNNSSGTFGRFSMQNLISSPMTKDEALKILDLNKSTTVNYSEIMGKYNKIVKMNDPEKGGSFYIQNKAFYAKEFLLVEFPASEEDLEKEKSDRLKEESDKIEKEKNKKI